MLKTEAVPTLVSTTQFGVLLAALVVMAADRIWLVLGLVASSGVRVPVDGANSSFVIWFEPVSTA
jgi:hypothetical protein